MDGGFVGDAFVRLRVAGLGELHLRHPAVGGGEGAERGLASIQLCAGVDAHGLVVQMPVGQRTACLGKGAEVGERLHGGDAREFLAQVVGVAGAVVGGIQQPERHLV